MAKKGPTKRTDRKDRPKGPTERTDQSVKRQIDGAKVIYSVRNKEVYDMIAVTALSLPEIIILTKVLKPKLLAVFVGIMAVSIITIGYLSNVLLP